MADSGCGYLLQCSPELWMRDGIVEVSDIIPFGYLDEEGGKMMGMVHIYTGDGKGKTTAAVGLCTRAAGHGKKAAFYEFLKGAKTGEAKSLGCAWRGVYCPVEREKFT